MLCRIKVVKYKRNACVKNIEQMRRATREKKRNDSVTCKRGSTTKEGKRQNQERKCQARCKLIFSHRNGGQRSRVGRRVRAQAHWNPLRLRTRSSVRASTLALSCRGTRTDFWCNGAGSGARGGAHSVVRVCVRVAVSHFSLACDDAGLLMTAHVRVYPEEKE